jgi:hypothetical protein
MVQRGNVQGEFRHWWDSDRIILGHNGAPILQCFDMVSA